jgi:GTPase SAR1 family protein
LLFISSHRYDSCWPALSYEANGLVFVYNPKDGSQTKELNQWYTHFVQNTGIKEDCCLVIANKYDSESITSRGEAKLGT